VERRRWIAKTPPLEWIEDEQVEGILTLKVMSGYGERERQVSVERVIPGPGLPEEEAQEVVVVRMVTGCGRWRIEVRRERDSGGRDCGVV